MQPRPLLSPPSACLAARPLVRYLGAGCMGFLAADGVLRYVNSIKARQRVIEIAPSKPKCGVPT
eukprot:scaffold111334_cov34-Tisochrysis_lutea.AAC.8